jgi:hypothetical protein
VLFLKADADNSGGVDAEELFDIFEDLGEKSTKRELRALVRKFGHEDDDDYAVDFDGFCEMMVSVQRQGRLGGVFDFDPCGGMTHMLAQNSDRLDEILATCTRSLGRLRLVKDAKTEAALRRKTFANQAKGKRASRATVVRKRDNQGTKSVRFGGGAALSTARAAASSVMVDGQDGDDSDSGSDDDSCDSGAADGLAPPLGPQVGPGSLLPKLYDSVTVPLPPLAGDSTAGVDTDDAASVAGSVASSASRTSSVGPVVGGTAAARVAATARLRRVVAKLASRLDKACVGGHAKIVDALARESSDRATLAEFEAIVKRVTLSGRPVLDGKMRLALLDGLPPDGNHLPITSGKKAGAPSSASCGTLPHAAPVTTDPWSTPGGKTKVVASTGLAVPADPLKVASISLVKLHIRLSRLLRQRAEAAKRDATAAAALRRREDEEAMAAAAAALVCDMDPAPPVAPRRALPDSAEAAALRKLADVAIAWEGASSAGGAAAIKGFGDLDVVFDSEGALTPSVFRDRLRRFLNGFALPHDEFSALCWYLDVERRGGISGAGATLVTESTAAVEPRIDGARFLRLCQKLRLSEREKREDAQRERDHSGRKRRKQWEAALGARFDHQRQELAAIDGALAALVPSGASAGGEASFHARAQPSLTSEPLAEALRSAESKLRRAAAACVVDGVPASALATFSRLMEPPELGVALRDHLGLTGELKLSRRELAALVHAYPKRERERGSARSGVRSAASTAVLSGSGGATAAAATVCIGGGGGMPTNPTISKAAAPKFVDSPALINLFCRVVREEQELSQQRRAQLDIERAQALAEFCTAHSTAGAMSMDGDRSEDDGASRLQPLPPLTSRPYNASSSPAATEALLVDSRASTPNGSGSRDITPPAFSILYDGAAERAAAVARAKLDALGIDTQMGFGKDIGLSHALLSTHVALGSSVGAGTADGLPLSPIQLAKQLAGMAPMVPAPRLLSDGVASHDNQALTVTAASDALNSGVPWWNATQRLAPMQENGASSELSPKLSQSTSAPLMLPPPIGGMRFRIGSPGLRQPEIVTVGRDGAARSQQHDHHRTTDLTSEASEELPWWAEGALRMDAPP